MSFRVLYVGDAGWHEFKPAVRMLSDAGELVVTLDAAGARRLLVQQRAVFDLIVIAHKRPGEYDELDLQSLRAIAPLTGMIALLSSYCEGETRTGKPWAGAIRVYAHQFVSRFRRELHRLQTGGTAAWSPPYTATDEDRVLEMSDEVLADRSSRIAIVTADRQTRQALGDALEPVSSELTFFTSVISPAVSADIVIWDCPGSLPTQAKSLNALASLSQASAVIVLAGFPRPEEICVTLVSGITAVISKPFLAADLLWQVSECLNTEPKELLLAKPG
jgi:hypothetical protein